MSTKTKERYFAGIQFIPKSKEHGRLDHNVTPFRKRFQFREDQDKPLASLERVRVKGRFNLYLTGIWSVNMEKEEVGYDPKAEALALTSKGAKEGSLGEFAQEGLYIVAVGIRNLEPVLDVEKVLVELSYGRGQAKVHVSGSLPNLGMSQEEPIQGLISIAEMGDKKGETTGRSLAAPKYTSRIPGEIQKWVKDPNGSNSVYLMAPEDLSVLTKIRGALRVVYN